MELRGQVPERRALLRSVHPEDRRHFWAAVRKALYRRHGGGVRDVHVRYEPVRGEFGEPDRLVGTIHDITDRKRTEVRLR